jgi:hypothetical protein
MKRRHFLKTLPILAATPLALAGNSLAMNRNQRHLIALGTAACVMVNRHSDRLNYASVTLIDAFPIWNQKVSAHFVHFDYRINRQIDLHRNSRLVLLPTLTLEASIKDHLGNLSGDVVFVSGLGNGTGSLLSQSIGTQYLHANGHQRWVVTIPFDFEGVVRVARASMVSRTLIKHHDEVTFLDFEEIRSKEGNLSIRSAYEKADEWLIEELNELHG